MGGLKKPLSLKGLFHSSFETIHWLAKYSLFPRELAVRYFFLRNIDYLYFGADIG